MTNKMPLLMLACVLGAPSMARGQTAEEIVAAHIKASGGEQAIARIANFTSMFIDRDTNLLTRSTTTVSIPDVGAVSFVTDVGGYKPVAGVMLSTTMTQVAEGISTTNVTLDHTSVNTTVDAKIFAAR